MCRNISKGSLPLYYSWRLPLDLAPLRSSGVFMIFNFQKCRAYNRVNNIGYKSSETYIRQEMVCHMDPVITVYGYKYTGESKADKVLLHALFLADICQHRQGEHHRRYRHVSARPALEIIITAGQVWSHLPPVPELTGRIIEG